MPRYQRDPVSEWFDRAAEQWLERAYRRPGKWEPTYLAPPSAARRAQAHLMGEDLDKRDRWGELRWVRAFKRAVYNAHKLYGYAADFRPGDARASDAGATALRWETGGLLRKSGWPTRRRELRIMIVPGGAAADAAVARVPAAKTYTADAAYRSKPGPPDRPWDLA